MSARGQGRGGWGQGAPGQAGHVQGRDQEDRLPPGRDGGRQAQGQEQGRRVPGQDQGGKNYEKQTQTNIHQDKKDVIKYEAETKQKDFIQGETKGAEYQAETKGGKNEARTEDGENKALSGGLVVKTRLADSVFKNKKYQDGIGTDKPQFRGFSDISAPDILQTTHF